MRIVQRSPTMSSVRATGQGSMALLERVTIDNVVTMRLIVHDRVIAAACARHVGSRSVATTITSMGRLWLTAPVLLGAAGCGTIVGRLSFSAPAPQRLAAGGT